MPLFSSSMALRGHALEMAASSYVHSALEAAALLFLFLWHWEGRISQSSVELVPGIVLQGTVVQRAVRGINNKIGALHRVGFLY